VAAPQPSTALRSASTRRPGEPSVRGRSGTGAGDVGRACLSAPSTASRTPRQRPSSRRHCSGKPRLGGSTKPRSPTGRHRPCTCPRAAHSSPRAARIVRARVHPATPPAQAHGWPVRSRRGRSGGRSRPTETPGTQLRARCACDSSRARIPAKRRPRAL